jgi:hypothetical protein
VLARGGKTRIRVSETLKVAAGGIVGGLTGGIGAVSLPIYLGLGLRFGTAVTGLAAWGATTVLAFIASRGLFGVHSRSRSNVAKALAERLAAQARESIDDAKPKIGPAPP